jgi:hypothetical protein
LFGEIEEGGEVFQLVAEEDDVVELHERKPVALEAASEHFNDLRVVRDGRRGGGQGCRRSTRRFERKTNRWGPSQFPTAHRPPQTICTCTPDFVSEGGGDAEPSSPRPERIHRF